MIPACKRRRDGKAESPRAVIIIGVVVMILHTLEGVRIINMLLGKSLGEIQFNHRNGVFLEKGYINLIPVVADFQVPVDAQLIDVGDLSHVPHALIWSCERAHLPCCSASGTCEKRIGGNHFISKTTTTS